MQRTWTIEVSATCSPEDKIAIDNAVRCEARYLYTLVGLLPTKIKVKAVAYSEDFFDGHEDLQLWDDVKAKTFEDHNGTEEAPSSELLEAAKDMRHER